MKQRPYHPPEPRVIALAATQSKADVKLWILFGAYAVSTLMLFNLLLH